MYVTADWWTAPKTNHIAQLPCMLMDFQEPYIYLIVILRNRYVILKRTPTTPLFDKRFINYGYNKVQLFEHLRAAGYHFYILTQTFAMDVPHEEYVFISLLITM